MGDFNIFSIKDETFQAIEKALFQIPASIKGTYTNAVKDRPFDQIAFQAKEVEKQLGLAKAGTFPFFDYVYRDDDWKTYQPDMTFNQYKQWRTFKMSDHLPLWVELFVDFGEAYLAKKMEVPANSPSPKITRWLFQRGTNFPSRSFWPRVLPWSCDMMGSLHACSRRRPNDFEE